MHVKFVEQKNWSQELKVKVNTYYHKMLESYFGRPEDLIELVNDILTQDKGFVLLPRKQLSDFLRHNERNLLEMFCQQGPPTKRWIETKGQYWQGWQDCNNEVKKFFEAFSQKGSLLSGLVSEEGLIGDVHGKLADEFVVSALEKKKGCEEEKSKT